MTSPIASSHAVFCLAPLEGGVSGSVKQYRPISAPSAALTWNATPRPAFCIAVTSSGDPPAGVYDRNSTCPTVMPTAIQPMVPHTRTGPKSWSRFGRWANASELVSAIVGA